MTREEAIAFLQDIKMNLEFLQTHYTQLQQNKQQQQQQQQVKVTTTSITFVGPFSHTLARQFCQECEKCLHVIRTAINSVML
jgi:hypothetical protein